MSNGDQDYTRKYVLGTSFTQDELDAMNNQPPYPAPKRRTKDEEIARLKRQTR